MPATATPLLLDWSWSFKASPSALWPLVSDTNRMNLLVGLAPVTYSRVTSAEGAATREGEAIMSGMRVRWVEHPFEWVENERLSVRRDFHNGPLAAYRSTVTLSPEGTGTRLRHTVELWPRHPIMRPLLALATRSMEGDWSRAYAAADAYVARTGPYPFGPAQRASLSGELAKLAAALEAGGQPSPRITKLLSLIAQGNDLELQRLQPFVLADRWNEDREGVLTLCLQAARAGLLELRWSTLCPHCRGPKGSVSHLRDLAPEATCEDCQLTFAGRFDESVELWFRPNPVLRPVSETVYCVAGPGATPHVAFQGPLAPGERRELALAVPPGAYRVRGGGLAQPLHLVYTGGQATTDPVTVKLSRAVAPEGLLDGTELRVTLENDTAQPAALVLERADWTDDVVTAAYAGSRPAFAALFPEEGLSEATQLPVGLLGFLACHARGAAALYEDLGPEEGHAALAAWLGIAGEAIAESGGTVFQSLDDTLVASFYDPLDTVKAGLAILRALEAAGAPQLARATSLGADAGPCHATGRGAGLNYRGAPVQVALESCRAAEGGEMRLSTALADEPGVRLLLAGESGWELLSAAEGDATVRLVRAVASAH